MVLRPRSQIVTTLATLIGWTMGAIVSWGAGDLVRFEGLQSVPQAKAESWIASQVEYVESAGASSARADDLAFFLESAMRQHGYSRAFVDWRLDKSGPKPRIILLVKEGTPQMLGTLSVEGNSVLRDEAIFELLVSATRKRMKDTTATTIPYVKEDIQKGQAQIVAFYHLMGYRNAKVKASTSGKRGPAHIHLIVDEGQESVVGEVILPAAPNQKLQVELDKIRSEFQNAVFSAAIAGNLASRIREAAVEAGFYKAKIDVSEQVGGRIKNRDIVDLNVACDWGDVVALSSVRVKGNKKVKTTFFERHFAPLLDRPYAPGKAIETVNDLLQTGVFETVRTDIISQDDGSYILDIDVEESHTRSLGIYGGFTNYEGPIGGFEFKNLNLFGMVRKIDSSIEFSKRGARGEANYTDPWFLDTPIQFGGGIFALNRKEDGYEKMKTGGRYEFSRRFGSKKQNTVALFGEASYTDVHDADISPLYLGKTNYLAHQLGVSISRDKRDDPRRPRKGYIMQASLAAASSAIGSEIEYWKATGRLGYYFPFGANTLRLGARSGIISPFGGTADIPIDLRYFNGGPFSVRSFQERGLGPRDPGSGYAIGGNFYTIFNVEYEIPIAAVPGLSVVPFADAGNLMFDESDISLDNLRYAVGLGLRYDTPIGPLRLEYGWNPDQRPGEPEGTLHLGFGLGY